MMSGCAMKLPQRIELWLLLAVIAAGLIIVFASHHRDDEPAQASQSSDDAPLMLHRCSIERDQENARLEIELRVQNVGADKLVLQTPKVKLLAANDREIPGFFLPFEPLPEVPAKATQDVQLRYWLEAADLKGVLNLDVEGHRIEVKGAKKLALNSLTNAEKKIFKPGEW
ncbi:MAG: hypothetical protein K8R87_00060 [Verrucomicrobia bacterium]|nr:hypothetical protein [Verrucomicrobiota bacterium]